MKKNQPTEDSLLRRHWRFYINLLTFFMLLLIAGLGILIIQPDFSSTMRGDELTKNSTLSSSYRSAITSGNFEPVDDRVIDGIHVATGMPVDERFELVKSTCTACHSAKLVTQNRATREGWKQMIVWMQETQNLWDLGNNEAIILDYLAEHYAPKNVGRRANLPEIEYYILNLD